MLTVMQSAYAWMVTRLHRDERGQDLIEYAMLSGLIAATLVAIGVLAAYTDALTDMADGIGSCIDFTAGGCTPF